VQTLFVGGSVFDRALEDKYLKTCTSVRITVSCGMRD